MCISYVFSYNFRKAGHYLTALALSGFNGWYVFNYKACELSSLGKLVVSGGATALLQGYTAWTVRGGTAWVLMCAYVSFNGLHTLYKCEEQNPVRTRTGVQLYTIILTVLTYVPQLIPTYWINYISLTPVQMNLTQGPSSSLVQRSESITDNFLAAIGRDNTLDSWYWLTTSIGNGPIFLIIRRPSVLKLMTWV